MCVRNINSTNLVFWESYILTHFHEAMISTFVFIKTILVNYNSILFFEIVKINYYNSVFTELAILVYIINKVFVVYGCSCLYYFNNFWCLKVFYLLLLFITTIAFVV